jgi:hypothetical protein
MNIYDSVTQKELLVEMKRLALLEADKNDADEYDSEDCVFEATNVIDEIFGSLTYSNKTDDVSDYGYLDVWTHRDSTKLKGDFQFMGIDRGRIQESVKIYLDSSWMHNHKTDWLIVNVLNYAEYLATDDIFKQKSQSINEYIEKKYNYLPEHKYAHITRKIKKGLGFLVSWLIWGYLVFFLHESPYSFPVVSYAFIALTIYYQIEQRKRNRILLTKMNVILDELKSTYDNCSNLNISWSLVWDSMIKSKDKMVVWDNLVFALVESRQKQIVENNNN